MSEIIAFYTFCPQYFQKYFMIGVQIWIYSAHGQNLKHQFLVMLMQWVTSVFAFKKNHAILVASGCLVEGIYQLCKQA